MPSLLDKIKDRAEASRARNAVTPSNIDAEFVEKLAHALDYAAATFVADVRVPAQAQYEQRPDSLQEKVASSPLTSSLLATMLKQKIAEKQNTVYADQAGHDKAVLQNIISRISTITENKTSSAPADEPAVEVEEEVDPVEQAYNASNEADSNESSTPDAGEAVNKAAEDPQMSLAAVVRTALDAKGNSESGSNQPVKTASARGKGPMAIADATNLLKEKLRSRIGSGK